jgi:nitrite reductase/ring-hydroxylating ferredoxin subunit
VPLAAEGSYHWDGSQVVVSLAAADQLKPVGGAVRLVLAGSDDAALKIVVVHAEDETYCSFADRCTHRGKELDYLHEDRMLQCRSGKAQFDLDGHMIRGPAERALLAYPTRRQGDHLVITVIV